MAAFEGVVENLRRAAVACRGARLALRNGYRCDLGAVHAQEVDEVAIRVDDSNVHFPIALLCLGFGSTENLLCFLPCDRHAIGNVERHGIWSPTSRWICRRLLGDRLAADKQRETKRRGKGHEPTHEIPPDSRCC